MTDLPAYELKRCKRRTLSIVIEREGALVVHAPMKMPIREIEAFLQQKRRWIAEKQAAAQAHPPFVLQDGAQLPWLGRTLHVRVTSVPAATERDGILLLPDTGDLHTHALTWRKQRAAEILGPRVTHWSRVTGLQPASVHYTHAQKRWGSMTGAGALRLNAALLHCTPDMCDYVIVHELCHLLHPDHSPAFHARVRSFLPQADEIRARMKAMAYVTGLLQPPGRME